MTCIFIHFKLVSFRFLPANFFERNCNNVKDGFSVHKTILYTQQKHFSKFKSSVQHNVSSTLESFNCEHHMKKSGRCGHPPLLFTYKAQLLTMYRPPAPLFHPVEVVKGWTLTAFQVALFHLRWLLWLALIFHRSVGRTALRPFRRGLYLMSLTFMRTQTPPGRQQEREKAQQLQISLRTRSAPPVWNKIVLSFQRYQQLDGCGILSLGWRLVWIECDRHFLLHCGFIKLNIWLQKWLSAFINDSIIGTDTTLATLCLLFCLSMYHTIWWTTVISNTEPNQKTWLKERQELEENIYTYNLTNKSLNKAKDWRKWRKQQDKRQTVKRKREKIAG